MIFDPLRTRPDCCVHLGGVPLAALVKVSSLLLFFRFRHLCPLERFFWSSSLLTILPLFNNSSLSRMVQRFNCCCSALGIGDALHLKLSLTISSLSGRTPVLLLLPHSAFRLGDLARWSHDDSSTCRPPRHSQSPSTCPFCHDTDGSLMHHLSTYPSHRKTRTAWAHCSGISPSDVPTFARHGWAFDPLDESNSPQTIRAQIRFVGLVCERIQSPSW